MSDRLASQLSRPWAQAALILGVTLFAAGLRFYKLGDWSFWGDEFITVERAQALFEGELSRLSVSLLGTNLVLAAGSVTEWSARLVPAVLGVLTIPVLYLVVRRMAGPFVALLAMGLLAVSPWHLYWSQNARFYTALLLFFSLAVYLFYLALEEDRPAYMVGSLLFLVLAMQERLLAAFFIPIALGYIVSLKLLRFEAPPGLRPRNLAIVLVPGLAAALVWSVNYLQPGGSGGASPWQVAFGFVNNNPAWILAGIVFYAGIPAVVMAAAGAAFTLRFRSRLGLILSLTAAIPVLAIVAIAFLQYTANRYAFVALASILVLAAIAVQALFSRVSRDGQLLAAGVLIVLLLAPLADNALYFRFQNGNRDNWKDAFAFIEQHRRPEEPVVTTHGPLARYYLGPENVSRMQRLQVSQILASETRMWFILDLTSPQSAPAIQRWVQQQATPVASFDVTVSARTFPMRIYLYDPGQRSLQELLTAAGQRTP